MRSLTSNWKASAVSQTAVAADVHQSFDVHLDLLAKISFDSSLLVDDISNSIYFLFGQFADSFVDVYSRFTKYLIRTRAAYAVNIRKANFRSLVSW
jgi:hypothetical protein